MTHQKSSIKRKTQQLQGYERLTQAALDRIRKKKCLKLLGLDELAEMSYSQPGNRKAVDNGQ